MSLRQKMNQTVNRWLREQHIPKTDVTDKPTKKRKHEYHFPLDANGEALRDTSRCRKCGEPESNRDVHNFGPQPRSEGFRHYR
jgi:hypothetical protein